jgi:hypothetical protein
MFATSHRFFTEMTLPQKVRSTWGQAMGLWLLTNLISLGIYLLGMVAMSGSKLSDFRANDPYLAGIIILLGGLGGLASLPTTILTKIIFSYTLRVSRRGQRLFWTLASVCSLYALGMGFVYALMRIDFHATTLDVLRNYWGQLIFCAPWLLGGILGTLVVYRRALLRPNELSI